MPVTFNEKLIAYLALFCGLAISGVAVYYSVVGLTAIFAAAVVPIIIMGTILEIGKLIATLWLKQNWRTAPFTIKIYLITAIIVLMIITSMGIFGFLSKAHLDQTVPTGDVANKIALIDDKIRVERDNIDVARKALKQLDDAVDQVMARSTTEQGANRAATLRRNQAKERSQLQADIAKAQETIKQLNEEKLPIQSQLRKVEAEVGPIKYIAGFFYGEADQSVLEKAVTWVIIVIIVVFDPLAIVLLLASQISFENFRQRRAVQNTDSVTEAYPQDNGPLSDDQIEQIKETVAISTATRAEKSSLAELAKITPVNSNEGIMLNTRPIKQIKTLGDLIKAESEALQSDKITDSSTTTQETSSTLYVQNEEQNESNLWNRISQEEYQKIVKQKTSKE